MRRYIYQRIIFTIVSVVIACVLIYHLQALFGRDPFVENVETFRSQFPKNTPTAVIIDTLHKQEGFDRPIFLRFLSWARGLFQGRPGKIYSAPDFSIPYTIFSPLRFTILVTLPVLITSYFFGIILGVVAAIRRGKFFDRLIVLLSNVFIAIPAWILSVAIILIALTLNIPAQFRRPGMLGNTYWDAAFSLLPPFIALVLPETAFLLVRVRNLTVTALSSNFIFFARTKGLSKTKVLTRYLLRNSLVPILGSFVSGFVDLYTGAWVVEQIFGIPGSSMILITWQRSGEINVIMFNASFIALFNGLLSILVDFCAVFMDPRIRYGRQEQRLSRIKYLLSYLRFRSREKKDLFFNGKLLEQDTLIEPVTRENLEGDDG